jgi:Double zinc ribbon
MPPVAYFGIESSGLNLVIDLLILFVVVLWLALVYWTFADARRRILDPMLVGCSTASSLFFPFVGTIVYVILRPPEYLEDVRERELEMQAAEARLYELDNALCPHCDYRIERDFIRCPSCLRKLKERCSNCSRPLDQAWTICPYCETDVPGVSSSRRTRRRRVPPVEDGLEEVGSGRSGASGDALDGSRPQPGRSAREREPVGEADDELRTTPVAASEPSGEPRIGRSSRPPGSRPRPT